MWVSSTSPLIRVFQSIHTDKETGLNPSATGSAEARMYLHVQNWGTFSVLGIKLDFKPIWQPPPFCPFKPSTGVKRQGGDETCVAKGHVRSLALPWPQPPYSALDFVSYLEKGQTKNVISPSKN